MHFSFNCIQNRQAAFELAGKLAICCCVCPLGLARFRIVVQMALFNGVGCYRAPMPTDKDLNVGLLCAASPLADCRNHGSVHA
ncbi:hypothetical protein MTO96_010079 [Rhipicephalus appendiculatus]